MYSLGIAFYVLALFDHFRWQGIVAGTVFIIPAVYLTWRSRSAKGKTDSPSSKPANGPGTQPGEPSQTMGARIKAGQDVLIEGDEQSGGGTKQMGNDIEAGGRVVIKGNRQS